MHFGTGPSNETELLSELHRYSIEDHLTEIDVCSKVSKSTFFIVSGLIN